MRHGPVVSSRKYCTPGARLLVALMLAVSTLSCTSRPQQPEAPDVAAPPAPPCPGVGTALPLPCRPGEVKLTSFQFFRSIGQDPVAHAGDGTVFALATLEWVGPPPAPMTEALTDGSGSGFPRDAAAEDCFLAMQPRGRFRSVAPADKPAPTLDVRVFRVPESAPASGMFLGLAAPGCAEATRFCLGKFSVR